MTQSKKPPPPETSPPSPSKGKESAFDLWLNRGLHKLFDDVANEPVPDDLLRLIEEDKNK